MMFDSSDPRSKIGSSRSAQSGPIRAPQFLDLGVGDPRARTENGSPTWVVRGQNFVVTLTDLLAGDHLDRPETQDEYFVLTSHAEAALSLEAGDSTARAVGPSVMIMPHGTSRITADSPTRVVCVFDSRATDVCSLAQNADTYLAPDPRVALLEPPAPAGPPNIRVWSIDDIADEEGRFGRIFRSSTLMVNYLHASVGPRDPAKLSPHHHDDFEQGSLALSGDFDHHIRTPWGIDMREWRPDIHQPVGSPSLAIIPPPTVHTTRATSDSVNLLIDIFSPPREDFQAQPGWVLNESEYSSPAGAAQ